MRKIPASELIINSDGSIFHLHLKPGQIGDTIILVGDPARVDRVASFFDSVEVFAKNREFVSVTGKYRGQRVSVVSTGIGTDNVDIVINELDALVNIDFQTRMVKPELKSLRFVRLGTCGAIQDDIKIGDLILSRTSVGFDGLLNYYAGRDAVCDLDIERAFVQHMGWPSQLTAPYFIDCSTELAELFADQTVEGITISAPGFYAPQGRYLRLAPAEPELNQKVASFRYNGRRITNFEMESSALAGLSALLGHRATTICAVIAQRVALGVEVDYIPYINRMIEMALDKLTR